MQVKLDNVASDCLLLLHPATIVRNHSQLWINSPQLSENDVVYVIERSAIKTCKLDPMPTPLVDNSIDSLLPVITQIINLSLSTGSFSA